MGTWLDLGTLPYLKAPGDPWVKVRTINLIDWHQVSEFDPLTVAQS